jgi:pimeloyl-ACP methyl ester carboxylesterase
MDTVISADGSRIAYDRTGSGPPVILVGGALSYRRFTMFTRLAALLAPRCTVINYDRRGRGDSTAATPFDHDTAVQREIEDLAALIEAAGGAAALWGISSGGALALHATAAGIGVERLSVYEVPFMVVPGLPRPTRDYGDRLDELVDAGDRDGAVRHFMRNAVGVPAPVVAVMRCLPLWRGLRATAPTLPYDWAAVAAHMRGTPLDPADWSDVTVPVQVCHGARSPAVLRDGSRALADVIPQARLHEVAGVSHNLKPRALAPLLADFLTEPAQRNAA